MKFEDYSNSFVHFHTDEIPDILKKHMPHKNFALADLGCGDGALLVALKRAGYLERAKRVVAVDLSQERLNRLSEYKQFELMRSDATDVKGLEAGSMDCIINTQVIEHLPDEHKLLDEIERILRRDGLLYIASVVKKRYGWFYYRTVDGRWALDPTHVREYESLEQFEGLIRSAGFTIIESSATPLRLSLGEFLVRRVIVPLFHPKDINKFFGRHKYLEFFRRIISIHPPGYFIVEVIAANNPA